MKDYNYKKLRNVGLIGHGATGKTSLAEALLFYTNNTDRLGKVEEGNTVMDMNWRKRKEEYLYQLQLHHLRKMILKSI